MLKCEVVMGTYLRHCTVQFCAAASARFQRVWASFLVFTSKYLQDLMSHT